MLMTAIYTPPGLQCGVTDMKYFVIILSLVISGCVPAMVAGGAITAFTAGAGIYCATTTQAAKESIRASTTGGKQVLACTDE